MHSNHDAQALIDSKIIKMIFKYFKGQIYLIIYLILRKLKSKTPCCLHYFGDGILGCCKSTPLKKNLVPRFGEIEKN
jgi:hypothetical protein